MELVSAEHAAVVLSRLYTLDVVRIGTLRYFNGGVGEETNSALSSTLHYCI